MMMKLTIPNENSRMNTKVPIMNDQLGFTVFDWDLMPILANEAAVAI